MAPQPRAEPDPVAPTATKSWKVGTLTYTAAGLVAVFCWLLWGDFAWMLKERSAQPIVQVMMRKFDASDLLTGLFLLSLPAMVHFNKLKQRAFSRRVAMARMRRSRARLGVGGVFWSRRPG